MVPLALLFAGVLTATYAGAGVLTTVSGSYPLDSAFNSLGWSGRGVLQFRAGWGAVALSGSQADHLAPGRYLLHIDRAAVLTDQSAKATCDMRTGADDAILRVTCRGFIGPKRDPFSLRWSATPPEKPQRWVTS